MWSGEGGEEDMTLRGKEGKRGVVNCYLEIQLRRLRSPSSSSFESYCHIVKGEEGGEDSSRGEIPSVARRGRSRDIFSNFATFVLSDL